MLSLIKKSLRINNSALDDEIEVNISACKADLALAGISWFDNDSLLTQAVKTYCKWQYDFEGQADRYLKAYEHLKISLCLSGDYNE